MIGGRLREGISQGVLQLQTHRYDDLADQIVLAGEVIDDGPVVDPKPFGQPPEGQLAESVFERGSERSFENLFFGVSMTHVLLDCSDYYEYRLQ